MKRLTLAVFLLAALLASCAPRVWYRPGATSSQRDRDLESCRYQARARFVESTPALQEFHVYLDFPIGTPYLLQERLRRAAENAVESEYESYRSEFESEFVRACMKKKGYSLVKE